jgi:hypothetical protein
MGVTMVASGIDGTVIRSLFGHVSLDTTYHYARANYRATFRVRTRDNQDEKILAGGFLGLSARI